MTPVIGPNGELLSGPGVDPTDQGGTDSDSGAPAAATSPPVDRCSPGPAAAPGAPLVAACPSPRDSPGLMLSYRRPGQASTVASYQMAAAAAAAAAAARLSPCTPVSGLCLLYTSPSPRDRQKSRMPSSA